MSHRATGFSRRLSLRIDRRQATAGGRCRAFTLIELLIVLGIVGVLIGLIVPAVGRVRQQALSAKCLSNLRQMATAAHGYATAGDKRYPVAYYTSVTATTVTSYNWDFTLTRLRGAGNPWTVKPGLLWATQGTSLSAQGESLGVQQCPSFQGATNSGGDPFTGYNYNTSFIGHGESEAVAAPARLIDVKDPASCALFGDGGFVSGANKFMRAPFPNPGDATFRERWAGTQAFRHLGRTNVVFADHHAASVSERYTTTAPGDIARIADGTGFLSPDNEWYDLD